MGAFGPPQRRQIVVGLAYRRLSPVAVKAKIRLAGGIAMDKMGTDDAVVIAVDVEKEWGPAAGCSTCGQSRSSGS